MSIPTFTSNLLAQTNIELSRAHLSVAPQPAQAGAPAAQPEHAAIKGIWDFLTLPTAGPTGGDHQESAGAAGAHDFAAEQPSKQQSLQHHIQQQPPRTPPLHPSNSPSPSLSSVSSTLMRGVDGLSQLNTPGSFVVTDEDLLLYGNSADMDLDTLSSISSLSLSSIQDLVAKGVISRDIGTSLMQPMGSEALAAGTGTVQMTPPSMVSALPSPLPAAQSRPSLPVMGVLSETGFSSSTSTSVPTTLTVPSSSSSQPFLDTARLQPGLMALSGLAATPTTAARNLQPASISVPTAVDAGVIPTTASLLSSSIDSLSLDDIIQQACSALAVPLPGSQTVSPHAAAMGSAPPAAPGSSPTLLKTQQEATAAPPPSTLASLSIEASPHMSAAESLQKLLATLSQESFPGLYGGNPGSATTSPLPPPPAAAPSPAHQLLPKTPSSIHLTASTNFSSVDSMLARDSPASIGLTGFDSGSESDVDSAALEASLASLGITSLDTLDSMSIDDLLALQPTSFPAASRPQSAPPAPAPAQASAAHQQHHSVAMQADPVRPGAGLGLHTIPEEDETASVLSVDLGMGASLFSADLGMDNSLLSADLGIDASVLSTDLGTNASTQSSGLSLDQLLGLFPASSHQHQQSQQHLFNNPQSSNLQGLDGDAAAPPTTPPTQHQQDHQQHWDEVGSGSDGVAGGQENQADVEDDFSAIMSRLLQV